MLCTQVGTCASGFSSTSACTDGVSCAALNTQVQTAEFKRNEPYVQGNSRACCPHLTGLACPLVLLALLFRLQRF